MPEYYFISIGKAGLDMFNDYCAVNAVEAHIYSVNGTGTLYYANITREELTVIALSVPSFKCTKAR